MQRGIKAARRFYLQRVLSKLFVFLVVAAAAVFNFGAPVCTLRTLPAAAAARPCIAANEEVARTLRVDWTHCSMPIEPEEAAGALFGLRAALQPFFPNFCSLASIYGISFDFRGWRYL